MNTTQNVFIWTALNEYKIRLKMVTGQTWIHKIVSGEFYTQYLKNMNTGKVIRFHLFNHEQNWFIIDGLFSSILAIPFAPIPEHEFSIPCSHTAPQVVAEICNHMIPPIDFAI